ncbi:NAD-dependent epimerase/dehydratase family protein [Mucilaginibacter aquariorum]|uniref:NAD-dependent epimerase/dehydratase family protein n=1 Tax=Mucilaginibacter aquariorum TaxID=2967225 RepID=A0ABT1T8Z6_9SPHI|nr:NAD-dependent epimerase/dehydratase family protein [Mucilaginibacter aquariorum]MCQ6960943.1 NAD-dependent epimerase/dehydratase family protein [Mucilaginibacter aquariorum]
MNQNNHYLLTGASGFLGRIIKAYLTSIGYTVTGLDLHGQSINVDITKQFKLDVDINLQVVVHAAGKAHSIPKNSEEEKVFYDVNFEGTKNICAAIELLKQKPKSFIFISTVAVYGLDSGNMISEGHPLNGMTPYAKSKILAENWLAEWARRNDIILGILRLPLIAGPNPPGNLGAMINGIRTGRYLSIGSASAKKSVIWQEDIASIIPTLANVGGTYNLTDGNNPSFKQLELVIAKSLGKKKPASIPFFLAKILALTGDILGPRFPINSDKLKKITSNLTFDDSKACNDINWSPSSVIEKLSKEL